MSSWDPNSWDSPIELSWAVLLQYICDGLVEHQLYFPTWSVMFFPNNSFVDLCRVGSAYSTFGIFGRTHSAPKKLAQPTSKKIELQKVHSMTSAAPGSDGPAWQRIPSVRALQLGVARVWFFSVYGDQVIVYSARQHPFWWFFSVVGWVAICTCIILYPRMHTVGHVCDASSWSRL